MRWTIGLDDGRIIFEGAVAFNVPEPHEMKITRSFTPDDVVPARCFIHEWMIDQPSVQVMLRSSCHHPLECGLDQRFDVNEWIRSVLCPA